MRGKTKSAEETWFRSMCSTKCIIIKWNYCWETLLFKNAVIISKRDFVHRRIIITRHHQQLLSRRWEIKGTCELLIVTRKALAFLRGNYIQQIGYQLSNINDIPGSFCKVQQPSSSGSLASPSEGHTDYAHDERDLRASMLMLAAA